ncbi:hypothetical protein Gpo141_00011914 [Globisporangium polare]
MAMDPRIPVRSRDGAVVDTKPSRYLLLPPNEHEALTSKRSHSSTASSQRATRKPTNSDQARRVQSGCRPTAMLETPPRSLAPTSTTAPSTRTVQSRSFPGYSVAARERIVSPSAASEQRSSNGTCSSSTSRFDHPMEIPPPFRAKSNVKGRWQRVRSKVGNGVTHVVTTFYR